MFPNNSKTTTIAGKLHGVCGQNLPKRQQTPDILPEMFPKLCSNALQTLLQQLCSNALQTLRLKLCISALLTAILKLCVIALLTVITCCLVNFNNIALQTLSTCCLKNTSIHAAAHVTPGTPTTPKNASGLITHHSFVWIFVWQRFEIFRTERGTLARLTRSLRNSRWKSTGLPT